MIMENKPECKLSGEGTDIITLIDIVSKTLTQSGYEEESNQMYRRVLRSANWVDAYRIIQEYVEIV